jgi:hypothetical protein
LLFLLAYYFLPANVVSGSLSGLLEILILLSRFFNPFPNKKIASRINRVEIFHIMRKSSCYNLVTMCFERDSEVTFKREEVVKKDEIILSASDQKSTVSAEIQSANVAAMSRLVLLNQHQRFEATINTRTFIDRKAMLLSDGQKSTVKTEDSCPNWSLEVKLANHEVALKIEDSGMTSVVNSDEGDTVGRGGHHRVGMRILEGQDGCLVGEQINAFDSIAYRSQQNVLSEEAISVRVARL